MKGHTFHVQAKRPERMDVTVSGSSPVDELDAELEGRLRLADEVVLVEAQHPVEVLDLRDRRLADAHRADFLGLDDLDPAVVVLQDSRQRRRGHPAGGSAANYNDRSKTVCGHFDLASIFTKESIKSNDLVVAAVATSESPALIECLS